MLNSSAEIGYDGMEENQKTTTRVNMINKILYIVDDYFEKRVKYFFNTYLLDSKYCMPIGIQFMYIFMADILWYVRLCIIFLIRVIIELSTFDFLNE